MKFYLYGTNYHSSYGVTYVGDVTDVFMFVHAYVGSLHCYACYSVVLPLLLILQISNVSRYEFTSITVVGCPEGFLLISKGGFCRNHRNPSKSATDIASKFI